MKKSFIAILSLFFIISSAAANVHAIDYSDYESLTVAVNISNSFYIQASPGSEIRAVNATIDSFPIDDPRQRVYTLQTSPAAVIKDTITFSWNDVGSAAFSIFSKARVYNKAYALKEKVEFPIKELDQELSIYVKPTELLDITPEIRDLAASLVEDTDDLYEVEYILAEFVRKNVAYDLGSLTADANQKSSWVLQNRKGVCDEITNLFISLNRALGIPTKYVSGVAYTSLEIFDSNWVPHAWVEVYFPGFGWIPYDVTYGQYGFVDAGHIKLSENYDSKSTGVRYNYVGSGIDLKPGRLVTEVDVTDVGMPASARYDFDVELYDYDVKFGSYNIVAVDVINYEDYYQVADLYLGETEDIEIIESSVEKVLGKVMHRKEVLLAPRERKKIYWRIKVDDALNKNYVYRFPIIVYNSYNDSDSEDFFAKSRGRFYDKGFVDEYVKSFETKTKDILVDCSPDRNELYPREKVNIQCVIDNKEDQAFGVQICLEDICVDRILGITKIYVDFNKTYGAIGLKNIAVKLIGNDWTKTGYTRINVVDPPNITIINMEYPLNVGFDEYYSISFELSKNSYSNPKNLTVMLMAPLGIQEWTLEELNENRVFRLESNGQSMKRDKNEYKIAVVYHDMTGREYYREETFSINSQASFFQKIVLWFNELSYRLSD